MRISDNMIAASLIVRLQKASARLFRLQEKVASGLAFSLPSQDPPAAMRAAALRSGVSELSRYRANCDVAAARLHLTESALANIADSLREAYSAALGMTPFDEAGNNALADRIHQIAASIAAEANAASEGRYLFSGHQTLTQPLTPNPDGIPPYAYQGDRGDIVVQLGRDVPLVTNIDAAEVLNMDGEIDPDRDDALETLRKAEAVLRSGDMDALANVLSAIQWHVDRTVALRGQVGARLQHVDLAKQRLEDGVRTLQSLLSETQDTDITRVLIDLKAQEVAYQAAAAAASALHRASLLEYL